MTPAQVKVLLTADDIVHWREERAKLEATIKDAQERIASLTRKLDAAAVFMPKEADENIPPTQVEKTAEERGASHAGMTDYTVQMLERTAVTMSPSEIRANLESSGFRDQIRSNPNYLYTMIARLSAKGRIVKNGAGYRAPIASPQGETGAVAAPASSQPLN